MSKRMRNEELEENKPPAELTHLALGTFQDANDKWHLVKIMYNPLTGDVGTVEVVINDEGSRDRINYEFRIQAVNSGLVG